MFKLKLNNFRGFLNQEFDFSRVNILIGENSAGKSSIFKFLLALKQSLRSRNDRASNLTLSGEYVDLGNYKETIYNHEIDRNLFFSFEFGENYHRFFSNRLPKGHKFNNFLENIAQSKTVLNFELSKNLSYHKNIIFSINNETVGTIKFVFPQDENIAEQDIYLIGESPKCELIFESKYFNQVFELKEVEYEKQAFLTLINGSLKNSIAKYSNLEEAQQVELHNQLAYLLTSQNFLQRQLIRLEYVNPLLDDKAERMYSFISEPKRIQQIKNIRDLIEFLEAPTTNEIFKTDLTNFLKKLGLLDDFYIKKEGPTREFRVIINGMDSNILDVGFGVSLQIPIFAQALFLESIKITTIDKDQKKVDTEEGKTLLIEQPEIHLHPALQAKFMETLLSIGSNNVYFIETHSEHIVRRLQVMVKNGGIASNDISIHYFKEMQKSEHKINSETGKLRPNFPKGFYDVSYDLGFQLMS